MNSDTNAVIETAASTGAATPNDTWGMILYVGIICAVIYFFMIRPNKKRMDEYKKMISELKVGSRVMAAGIYGTIKKVKDASFDIEIAKGVVIEVNKNAIVGLDEAKK